MHNFPLVEPPRRTSLLCGLVLIFHCASGARADVLGDLAQSFAASEFQFQRQKSNVPFQPLAWLSTARYGSTDLRTFDGDRAGSFEQSTASQAVLVPMLLGPRDLLLVGEWVSLTHFEADAAADHDLDVLSIAIPMGWMRQTSDAWQVAVFVAPTAHRATDHGAPWYWETMGGVFFRYVPEGRWWWLFGAYADVSPDEDFYIPYAGASFLIDERWTLSMVLPWPALLYAPTTHWLFRLGVTPAGTSWAIEPERGTVALDTDAWNLGLSAERRVWGNFWLRAEAGVSGFRGFGFIGSDWENPNADAGTSPYVTIGINFRPAGIQ